MSAGPGRFITVEGIEGAGKSTCMRVLQERLAAHALPYVTTREPGGTALGEALRELLLGHRHDGMADDTELLLMFAARAEHLRNRIEPSLRAGHWVLCDRFTDATYAYQGGGRGLSRQRIAVLEDWVQGACRPQLTLLLDVPVHVGLERAGRRSTPDRFEREQVAFHERVRQAYLDIAAADPLRVRLVDASRPAQVVADDLAAIMDAYVAANA